MTAAGDCSWVDAAEMDSYWGCSAGGNRQHGHNGGNCHAAQQPLHWATAAVNPTTTHTLGAGARAHLGRPIAINQVTKISKLVLQIDIIADISTHNLCICVLRPPQLGPSLQAALSAQPPPAPQCARGCCSKLGFNFSYGPVLTPRNWRNICIAHLWCEDAANSGVTWLQGSLAI